MTTILEQYADIVGWEVIDQLYQLAAPLKGIKVVHVNSTRKGGGVAEILNKLVPLQKDLGIDVTWEVIKGNKDFFKCTKSIHNSLQGSNIELPQSMMDTYEKTNEKNAEKLKKKLNDADIVFIHDPQPAPLIKYFPERKGKWIWRCHIDVSKPQRTVWKYIKNFVKDYDASIFSLPAFAQPLPHPEYLIPPSIDPLSEKNMDLSREEIEQTVQSFGIDIERPIMLQVSRFDRFKDPVGVIQAFKLTKKFVPSIQLVLAGGEATDDPESNSVIEEVRLAANSNPDIHILLLPPDAHRTINALQRGADIIIQKSTKEGFGLTVTEALWKGKPVIGGDVGGIRIQVVNHHTGFLVKTPEGAALRARYLLFHRERLNEMGKKAKIFVKENFLLTRHLREYLTVMVSLKYGVKERIELG
ncbi:MAG: glycosyl transferase family 1 [Candidatus Latescibacteria bacterium 4484_7]|nr:MAG: glycosyl transferase family 1 [Candidatus Latescibacteria bacterium 4484_7]